MTTLMDQPPIDTTSEESPAMLRDRIDRLTTTVQLAEGDRDRARRELEEFKGRVAEVGDRAAREYGWCHVFDGILDELGLTRPVRRVSGTVTVTLIVAADPVDPTGRGGVPDSDFFRDSIRDSAFMYDVMDGDWTNVEVILESIDVQEVAHNTD